LVQESPRLGSMRDIEGDSNRRTPRSHSRKKEGGKRKLEMKRYAHKIDDPTQREEVGLSFSRSPRGESRESGETGARASKASQVSRKAKEGLRGKNRTEHRRLKRNDKKNKTKHKKRGDGYLLLRGSGCVDYSRPVNRGVGGLSTDQNLTKKRGKREGCRWIVR